MGCALVGKVEIGGDKSVGNGKDLGEGDKENGVKEGVEIWLWIRDDVEKVSYFCLWMIGKIVL